MAVNYFYSHTISKIIKANVGRFAEVINITDNITNKVWTGSKAHISDDFCLSMCEILFIFEKDAIFINFR